MSTAEKQADIDLAALKMYWSDRHPNPDTVLLAELRFALETMDLGVRVLNPRMLVTAARFRISTLEQNKNKAKQ